MPTSRSAYTFILFAMLLPISIAHPAIRNRGAANLFCEGCGNNCDDCPFGFAMTMACGVPRDHCLRGPGEICGGPSDSWGVCGEGLFCICDKCTGCSTLSLTCYDNPLCTPHQALDPRSSFHLLKQISSAE